MNPLWFITVLAGAYGALEPVWQLVQAVVPTGMWLVGKAIDQMTEDYCCKKCGHKFS